MYRLFTLAVPLALTAGIATAADFAALQQNYLNASIRGWAEDAVLVDAIKTANAQRAGVDQAGIDALDAAWRAEVGAADTPTITPALTSSAADFLRQQVMGSKGVVTEAFITDAFGLNVAVSAPTSDMWQGDEEKFTETFPKGKGASYFAEVEFDDSTQTYAGQISVAISDPANGEVIGTLTVGVNAEALK